MRQTVRLRELRGAYVEHPHWRVDFQGVSRERPAQERKGWSESFTTKRILGGFGLVLIAAGIALMAGVLLSQASSNPAAVVEFGLDDSALTGFTTTIRSPAKEPATSGSQAGQATTPAETASSAPLARI